MLENPRTGDLVRRTYMQNFPHADFDYCEFAEWGYKKPTRIWGSSQLSLVMSKICKGACPNMAKPEHGQRPRHRQWLGAYGPKPSTVMKYRIPEKLVLYLIEQLGLQEWGGGAPGTPPPLPCTAHASRIRQCGHQAW